MSRTLSLADSLSLGDLHVFLRRAATVEDGSVRLIAGSGVLAVYVAVLYPAGLLDESPTVLGLRTFALRSTEEVFDVVVPLASMQQRLERLQAEVVDASAPVRVTLPIEVNTMTWSAISPPRGGWRQLDGSESALFETAARQGIDEITEAVPSATGEQLVRKVRSEIWSRPMNALAHIPAGGAFAAHVLGFLAPEDTVRIYETGPWTRLTTTRGHVLIKRRAWSLQR